MRFKHSICRYDADDVVRRVFALMGFPDPPLGKARQCAEAVLKEGGFVDMLAASIPNGTNGAVVIAHRQKLTLLLKMLDVPRIEPTVEQVKDDKQLGQSLAVVCPRTRASIEFHAGIGAIFYRADLTTDTLVSQVAPITGEGLDRRRDYLLSVIETTRNSLEQTFS